MLEEAVNYITTIDWANPSWDLFVILFFFIGSFVYGISLGRDRTIIMMLGIYIALAVVNYAPYLGELGGFGVKLNDFVIFKATSFLGLFLLIFFFLSQSALSHIFASEASYGRWWQVLIFSVLHVGLLISVTLTFLPEHITGHLNPTLQQAFISNEAFFFWLMAPLVTMMLIREKDYRY